MNGSPADLAFRLLKYEAWGVGSEGVEGPDSLADFKSPADPNRWLDHLTRRKQRDQAFSQTPSWFLSQLSPVARQRMGQFKVQSGEAARSARMHHEAQNRYLESLGSPNPKAPPEAPHVRLGPGQVPVWDQERDDTTTAVPGIHEQRNEKTGRLPRPSLIQARPLKHPETGDNVLDSTGQPVIGDISRTAPFARPLMGHGGRLRDWAEKGAGLLYATSAESRARAQGARETGRVRDGIHSMIDRRGYALPEETEWLERDKQEAYGLAGLSPKVQQMMASSLGLVPKTTEESNNPWSGLSSDEKKQARAMGFSPKSWVGLPEDAQEQLLTSWGKDDDVDDTDDVSGDEWDDEDDEDDSAAAPVPKKKKKTVKVKPADKKKAKGKAKRKAGKPHGKKKPKKKPKKKVKDGHNHEYENGKSGKKRKWHVVSSSASGNPGKTSKKDGGFGFTKKALINRINLSHPKGYKLKLPKSGAMTARNFFRNKMLRDRKNHDYADRVHRSIKGHEDMTHESWVKDHLHSDMPKGYKFKEEGKTGVKRRKKPAGTKKKPAGTKKKGKCDRCGRPYHHDGKCTMSTDSDGKKIGTKKKRIGAKKARRKKSSSKGTKRKVSTTTKKKKEEDPWAASDDEKVGTSYDSREPIDTAWSLLKSGR